MKETGKTSQKDLLKALTKDYNIKLPDKNKIITEKSIYNNSKWLKLNEIKVVDNKTTNEYIYSRIIRPDFCQIILKDSYSRIMLQLRYRLGSKSYVIDLPGGAVDDGESPLQAAKRELKEEIGLQDIELRYLRSLYIDPMRSEHKGHFFKANNTINLENFKGKVKGELEESTFFWFDKKQLNKYSSIIPMSTIVAFSIDE